MNPIGIQYLYWNDIPLRQAVELTARSGAEVFECGTTVLTNLTRQERQDLSRMVRDHGLSLTLNGGMPGADPCSPDQAVREESIRLCQQAIDAAADAGSSIWGGIYIQSGWIFPTEPLRRRIGRTCGREAWKRCGALCPPQKTRG